MRGYGRGFTTVRALGLSLSRKAAEGERQEAFLYDTEVPLERGGSLPSPHSIDELALFLGRAPARSEAAVVATLREGYERVYAPKPQHAAGYRRG